MDDIVSVNASDAMGQMQTPALCSTRHDTVQHDAVRHDAARHGAVRHGTT